MNNFLTQIIGTSDLSGFLANNFFALIGIIFSLLIHVNNRNVLSERSPVQFSVRFLVVDNLKRLAVGLLSVFIVLRFSEQLVGAKLNPFLALSIGLSIDNLVKLLQAKVSKVVPSVPEDPKPAEADNATR